MERGAAVLRRVGLGRVVEAVGARVASTDFEVEVDGLRLAGDHLGQLYYVREVLESGREGYFVELVREAARPGATVLEAGAHRLAVVGEHDDPEPVRVERTEVGRDVDQPRRQPSADRRDGGEILGAPDRHSRKRTVADR